MITLAVIAAFLSSFAWGAEPAGAAAQACDTQPEPEVVACGGTKARSFDDIEAGRRAVGECADELQNCIKNLMGDDFRLLTTESGRVVLQLRKQLLADAAQLSIHRGETRKVSLASSDNAKVAGGTVGVANGGLVTSGKKVAGMPPGSYGVEGSSSASGKPTVVLTNGKIIRKLTAEEEVLDPYAIDIEDQWKVISAQVTACQELRDEIAHPAVEVSEAGAGSVAPSLMCALRQANGDLQSWRLLKSWPGCACDVDGRGRVLSGVCVTKRGAADPYTGYPIDERVPKRMGNAIAIIKAKLGAAAPVSRVNVIGCGLPRFERGGNTKKNIDRKRIISEDDVSEHAKGLACDIDGLAFDGGASPFNMFECRDKVKGKACSDKAYPYFEVLKKMVGATSDAQLGLKVKKLMTAPGFQQFYEQLEAKVMGTTPPTGADGKPLSPQEWATLKQGVVTRNAFVQAGFLVDDPLINPVHRDHFHIEIPASNYAAATLTMENPDRVSYINCKARRAAQANAPACAMDVTSLDYWKQ